MREKTTPNGKIDKSNLATARHMLTTNDHKHYHGLVLLVADALDLAAKGEDVWLAIGQTRARDAFTLTVHRNGDRLYASGLSLRELSTACEELL